MNLRRKSKARFNFLLCITLIASMFLIYASPALGATSATVNWNANYQTIDGFGGSASFHQGHNLELFTNTTNRAHILDLLFSQTNGIGLSMLRNMVGDGGVGVWGDGTDGPTPTIEASQGNFCWDSSCGFSDDQLWFINQAKAYGVTNFQSTVWSPPAWMKTNNSVANGGYLATSHYQDYANYLVQYIQGYQSHFGITIGTISLANEPDLSTGYSSCLWTADQFKTFIKDYLTPTFASNNITANVMMPEMVGWGDSLASSTLADPVASARVNIIGTHHYNGTVAPMTNASGKKIWMTEFYPGAGQATDATITNGLIWAKDVHDYLTVGGASAVDFWWLIGKYMDNGDLIGINTNDHSTYTLSKRLYTFGNYSRFIRPGFVRIDVPQNPATGIYLSAFKDPATGKMVVVAINNNTSSQSLNISLQNISIGSVTPYTTSSSQDLQQGTMIPVTNGAFTATLPAQSVTTFTGTSFDSSAKYKIINVNSGKGLDVANASTANSANVQQYTYYGNANQQWTLTDVGGGYYKILNLNSLKALDVVGGSTADGANVLQYTYSGNANQLWSIVDVGGGYYKIINKNSGKGLDVANASTADAANVQQYTYYGNTNQQWSIVKVP